MRYLTRPKIAEDQMVEFCVKYGPLHEATFRRLKSREAAIGAAAEKWWPPTDVIRDYAVITERHSDGSEEIVVDTPQLLTLIQKIHESGTRH
jgi:hypothetical protein